MALIAFFEFDGVWGGTAAGNFQQEKGYLMTGVGRGENILIS